MGGRSSHVCGSRVGFRGDLRVSEHLLMRFWVAGVGSGSPRAAMQGGKDRTPHFTPQPMAPMLCGAIFPP